jgi:hypothetical protein
MMALRTPPCKQPLPGLIEAFDSPSDEVTVHVCRKWSELKAFNLVEPARSGKMAPAN